MPTWTWATASVGNKSSAAVRIRSFTVVLASFKQVVEFLIGQRYRLAIGGVFWRLERKGAVSTRPRHGPHRLSDRFLVQKFLGRRAEGSRVRGDDTPAVLVQRLIHSVAIHGRDKTENPVLRSRRRVAHRRLRLDHRFPDFRPCQGPRLSWMPMRHTSTQTITRKIAHHGKPALTGTSQKSAIAACPTFTAAPSLASCCPPGPWRVDRKSVV